MMKQLALSTKVERGFKEYQGTTEITAETQLYYVQKLTLDIFTLT